MNGVRKGDKEASSDLEESIQARRERKRKRRKRENRFEEMDRTNRNGDRNTSGRL